MAKPAAPSAVSVRQERRSNSSSHCCYGPKALRQAYGGARICAKEIPRRRGAHRLTGSNAASDLTAVPHCIMRRNINENWRDTRFGRRFFTTPRRRKLISPDETWCALRIDC
jgi:hypothetical protein